MDIPLTSMEQLLPFPTAQELVAKKREPIVSVPPSMTVLKALQLMAKKISGSWRSSRTGSWPACVLNAKVTKKYKNDARN